MSLEILRALAACLGVAVTAFAVVNIFKLPRDVATLIVPTNFALAAVLFTAWWAATRRKIPREHVELVTVAVLWLSLANVLWTFSRVREPLQNHLVALLLIAAGSCLMSTRWLAAAIGGMLAAWAPVAWFAAPSTSERFQFGVVIFAATVLAVGTHLTRARVRRRLERSERRYRRLYEQSKDAVTVTTVDGRLIDINPAGAELFGYSPREIRKLDLRLDVYADPADRERMTRELLAKGFLKDYEMTFRKSDGSLLEVEATMSTILSDDGEVVAFLAVLRDVTGRKREQEELARYRAQLEDLVVDRTSQLETEVARRQQAQEEHSRVEAQFHESQKLESLGLLAGGLAHDFNNLLVGILGSAGMIRGKLPPGSPFLSHVERIETASKRASDLANQMLAYAGKGQFRLESCQLEEVVDEMANLLRASISKRAALDVRCESGDLPPIEADATQLRQVAMNLITNASDALGGEIGTVRVSVGVTGDVSSSKIPAGLLPVDAPESGWVYLEVADTGCGMDPKTQARIFDPFFTTKDTGRGLGMAAILGIVRGHRGLVEVESEVGAGTTFRILFPAVACPARLAPREGDSRVAAGIGPTPARLAEVVSLYRGSGTVLVVDDEELVRLVAKDCLEDCGFHVVLADGGHQAIEIFRRRSDDISAVLLDLKMPDLDGKEAYQRLREIDPGVQVVLTTGDPEDEATSGVEGLAGFLRKPFQPAALTRVFCGLTGTRRAARRARSAG